MALLKVNGFSCISQAEIQLKRLTVIIGPQASGKSVLSKLIFFFNDIFSRQFAFLEDEKPYSSFIATISEDFKKWFPPSAWGSTKFVIRYEAGPVTLSITRRGSRSHLSDDVNIQITESFAELYEQGLRQVRASRARLSRPEDDDTFVEREYESFWRIRESIELKNASFLGTDYVRTQTFVPAGRSFFTSIGKAIAAFDQSGMLDPVTVRFGRLFTTHRERGGRIFNRNLTSEEKTRQSDAMKSFFGGRIRIERDSEYIEAQDGRKVPFHILSSGQQELLPLWMVIGSLARKSTENRIIYIEEPEAHLFPSAQSLVVEYLAGLLSDNAPGRRMLITTHSPYVLSKINNLIRAGDLASRKRDRSPEIEKIIPKFSWMRSAHIQAYAILNGSVHPILDEDGLIDTEYLDAVSSDISDEFSRLLEIEVGE